MLVTYLGSAEQEDEWCAGLPVILPGATVRRWHADTPAGVLLLGAAPSPVARPHGLERLVLVGAGHAPDWSADVRCDLLADPEGDAGATEYLLHAVLAHHRQAQAYRAQRAAGVWRPLRQKLAHERTVGLLGLGALGTRLAKRLVRLGFRVLGWSQRPRAIQGVETLAGLGQLDTLFSRSEILIVLLRLVPDTVGLVDRRRLSLLPRGACVVNAAQGGLMDEGALLDLLDSGALAEATIDTPAEEPLPPGHRFWTHPQVTLTPRVAATGTIVRLAALIGA